MTASTQLRLVPRTTPEPFTSTDPTRAVFDRWVFMFGLLPHRTKLDTTRRAAINSALALYDGDVATVLLAVDGMAAVPLGDKPESMQDAMCEISWFLATAARIERCLRYGDQLHEVAAQQARAPAPPAAQDQADPQAARAARERVRQLAQQFRSARG